MNSVPKGDDKSAPWKISRKLQLDRIQFRCLVVNGTSTAQPHPLLPEWLHKNILVSDATPKTS